MKCCEAGMRGRSGLGRIQFWGLDDNWGLEGRTTGSGRDGGAKATDPPDDILQALACASASDLDKERYELFWELKQFLQMKGEGTQNTARDQVHHI